MKFKFLSDIFKENSKLFLCTVITNGDKYGSPADICDVCFTRTINGWISTHTFLFWKFKYVFVSKHVSIVYCMQPFFLHYRITVAQEPQCARFRRVLTCSPIV